jgi:hypothetical protein
MSIHSAAFRKGLATGLIVGGSGMYYLLSAYAPHARFVAGAVGAIVGVGLGLAFHGFIWSPQSEPIRTSYLAQRRHAPLKAATATALCVGATWLLASTTMSRIFFTSLFVAMGISSVVFYPKPQDP